MPAVVSVFVEKGDILACQKTLKDLINSFKADFSKYRKRAPELRISATFEAIVNQQGGKFQYSKVERLNYLQVKEGINLLEKAGLIIPVIHSSANGLPLGAQANYKKMKIIILDTGISQFLSGLQLSDILLSDDFDVVNKGAIAEQYVGLELLKAAPCDMIQSLYFWTRDNPKSHAEVDYLIQQNDKIIPIEVKSGKKR